VFNAVPVPFPFSFPFSLPAPSPWWFDATTIAHLILQSSIYVRLAIQRSRFTETY
jgi:hypothetical protein